MTEQCFSIIEGTFPKRLVCAFASTLLFPLFLCSPFFLPRPSSLSLSVIWTEEEKRGSLSMPQPLSPLLLLLDYYCKLHLALMVRTKAKKGREGEESPLEGKGRSFFLASTNFLFFGHLAPPKKTEDWPTFSGCSLLRNGGETQQRRRRLLLVYSSSCLRSRRPRRKKRDGGSKGEKERKKITAALCCMATSSFLSDSFRQKKICSLNLNNPNFDQEDRYLIYRLNAAISSKSLYMQFLFT